MSKHIPFRRRLGVLLAAALTFTTLGALAPSPADAAITTRDRLAGADRFETAVRVSEELLGSAGTADRVYVATGQNFPDALAAGPVAGASPILLVTSGSIPASTQAEIDRLAPREIVILGGPAAIGADVERALAAGGRNIIRHAGTDRFHTAALVSGSLFTPDNSNVVYVATGLNFADALLAGSVAGLRTSDTFGPVLLVAPDSIPTTTADEIRRLRPGRVVLIGNSSNVSDAVHNQLSALARENGGDAVRIGGSDQYETSVRVSRAYRPGTSGRVFLATGENYPDALTGSVLAASFDGPLLFARPDCIPASVDAEIRRLDPTRLTLFGGPAALSEEVRSGTVCGGGSGGSGGSGSGGSGGSGSGGSGGGGTPPPVGRQSAYVGVGTLRPGGGFEIHPGRDFNSAGGTNTVNTLGVGRYEVTFDRMDLSEGVIHVDAFQAQSSCVLNTVRPASDSIIVECTDAGAPADVEFQASFLRLPDGSPNFLYAVVDDPSATASHLSNGASNNVSGQAVEVERIGVGRHIVRFREANISGGGVTVTPTFVEGAECAVNALTLDGTDTLVGVECNGSSGSNRDIVFHLSVASGDTMGDPGSPFGYALSASASPPEGDAIVPPGDFGFNSNGGEVTVTRTRTGSYTVRIAGVLVDGGFHSVTTAGPAGARCAVGFTGSDEFGVSCIDPAGAAVDSAFFFNYFR
ncbi:MAG TPA: cell wall-binding repeat-containing protein [Acidimicrobiales bacterium]|nr:cell wall-binding repeat-containing protein [Acidimicrobiales bacterium]